MIVMQIVAAVNVASHMPATQEILAMLVMAHVTATPVNQMEILVQVQTNAAQEYAKADPALPT